jgi:hypothetical protein
MKPLAEREEHTMSEESGGPYLNMAVLCEKVLREQDGVISVIRVVERVTITPPPDAPEQMPPTSLNLVLAVALRAGVMHGQMNVRMTLTTPGGSETQMGSIPVLFEGQDRGVSLVTNLNLVVGEQGLYWISIYLEEQMLTRVPLRIMYQRIAIGPQHPQT